MLEYPRDNPSCNKISVYIKKTRYHLVFSTSNFYNLKVLQPKSFRIEMTHSQKSFYPSIPIACFHRPPAKKLSKFKPDFRNGNHFAENCFSGGISFMRWELFNGPWKQWERKGTKGLKSHVSLSSFGSFLYQLRIKIYTIRVREDT